MGSIGIPLAKALFGKYMFRMPGALWKAVKKALRLRIGP